jgi:hypothetical protein
VKLSVRKKHHLSRSNKNVHFIGNNTLRRQGGGRPKKWLDIENFIDNRVRYYWECGAPLTSEQLLLLGQQYVDSSKNIDAIQRFVEGKRNTLRKFVSRVLIRRHWSVRKISISQSVPVDWRKMAEDNSTRI